MRLAAAVAGTLVVLFATPDLIAAENPVDYGREVKPVLTAHCYACHGALQQKGGLRVDTAALIAKGGDSGPALVAGHADKSLLVDHLLGRHGQRHMPPRGVGEALTSVEIARLSAWINEGARAPLGEKPEPDPRAHWAFRPPVRPLEPRVKHSGFVRNPIDAFIAAAQEQHGLTAGRPADRRLLLRRVYLDLIGLPPTRQELAAFVADPAPDAYEKVVDRLLASPQYGERWGRHWMDIWRYSDPWGLGDEVRNSQKHIWHWRDWILASLNQDKGYDAMIREMLAADELYPNDLDRLRATGFLVRSYFKFNRNTWLEDTIEHTSKAFLGLTMNCARCHDHKFDPISQTDYYRFRAFFEPYQVRMDELPGQPDMLKDGLPRVFDCNLDAPTYLFVRGNEKQPKKNHRLRPGVPALLGGLPLDIRPVSLPLEARAPELRQFVFEDRVRRAQEKLASARQALARTKSAGAGTSTKVVTVAEAELAALRARLAADKARVQSSPEAHALARQAVLAERRLTVARAEADLAQLELAAASGKNKGEAAKNVAAARQVLAAARAHERDPGENYTPLRGAIKTPESNVETEASLHKPFPAISSGRRTALARWLTDRGNPLSA
ncbi:MAG TPA: DUF1549 domain-containing protein, partial [Gemmataceae bacterium]|nr:DUF1549 domain-containing protein [Gemmataceae bacterium]